MTVLNKRFGRVGLKLPEILLPDKDISLEKWAVIACDQYTSEKEYWHNVEKFINKEPSTLNLIFPECYLEDPNPEVRINKIHRKMNTYLNKNILTKQDPAFILVKRETGLLSPRYGLIAAVDLEEYDYSKGSKSLIRATEETVIERLPPRMKIREKAPLELSHILILIDDHECTVIEPLAANADKFKKIYDFDLMMNSGHITGYRIDNPVFLEGIASALENIADRNNLLKKYNSNDPLLFAMGDGNHSLASAKAVWENIKKTNKNNREIMQHPARWALVELVNIYCRGIKFEPIHRVLFNVDYDEFFSEINKKGDVKIEYSDNIDTVFKTIANKSSHQEIGFVFSNKYGIISFSNPQESLAAGTLQNFLDYFLEKHPDTTIDYIHGRDTAEKLGGRNGNIGLFLPSVDKSTFFKVIIDKGTLPRKTFSMGEAAEKRFYMESRQIQ